jgi:hypothetical protein
METKSFTTTTCTKTGNYYDDYPDKKIENQSIINLNYAYMKKVITLLILGVLLITGTSYAAVNGYSFTQGTTSYSDITGVAGKVVVATGTIDDTQYANNNIGFNFAINGTSFTQFSMASNGYVGFGSGTNSFGYTAISSAATGTACIAPFSQDLQGSATGEMAYVTTGTAPNRVCTIQWRNWNKYSNSTYAGGNYNFQVKLYETTNKIEIVYGSFIYGTYTGTYTTQVGLRGSANSDFINRMSTTGYAVTTAGTLNSSNISTSSTLLPASGLMFTFTPPVPSMFTATATSSSQVNLAWSADVGSNTLLIGYNSTGTFTTPVGAPPSIPSTVSGTTYIYSGTGASTFSHTGLTANTKYYYKAWAWNGVNYLGNGAAANATTYLL